MMIVNIMKCQKNSIRDLYWLYRLHTNRMPFLLRSCPRVQYELKVNFEGGRVNYQLWWLLDIVSPLLLEKESCLLPMKSPIIVPFLPLGFSSRLLLNWRNWGQPVKLNLLPSSHIVPASHLLMSIAPTCPIYWRHAVGISHTGHTFQTL